MDEEVCTLLKEWGLENYIDTFKENAITSMSLALLGSTEIRELLPVIGHRILFTRNLEDWRKAMHPNSSYVLTEGTQEIPESQDQNDCLSFSLSDILPDFQGSPSTSINDDQSIHKEGIDSLDKLLENSLEGRGILSIDKNRPLDNIARLRLVRIICTHILKTSPEQNITSQVYANWTREVVRLFPSENRSVYFHNKIVDSTRGIVSRLGGKLPDHVHNLKRKYRETGIIPKRKRSFSSSPCSSRASSPAPNAIKRLATAVAFEGDDETADENLQWLRNSSHPWETTEVKWEKTTRTRLRLLKDQSISDYFSEYPALKNANGYKLLVKDFNILYSSNYEGLAENFPKLKQDLYTLAKTKPKTKDKYLSDLLSLENVSEEISNLGACLLMNLKSLRQHFDFYHSSHEFIYYKCHEGDCRRSFSIFNSFRRHFNKEHDFQCQNNQPDSEKNTETNETESVSTKTKMRVY